MVVTAKSGYDLGYVWRGLQGQPERTAGGYYLNASLQGEALGRWHGRGAAALGLTGEVCREPYMAVYAQRHPATGEQLGRRPGQYVTWQERFERLLAAEPHPTAERRAELEVEAHRLAREPAPYTDVTVSFSKSISVLHASLRENARQARLAGDEETGIWWDGRERMFQEVLQTANAAAVDHAQRWAGVTRTGYHGAKANGAGTGRWDAAEIVVSSWLQGTSRAGDPQDHVHNQFARIARTTGDGRWRALDTMALRAQLPALAAVAAAHVEAGLSREFGVAWVPRTDGKGKEIRGVTQSQMDAYSTRAEAIRDATPRYVAAWIGRYGRAPNERELLHIQQLITLATRPGKDDGVIDWDECARRWDATLGGDLARVAHDTCSSACADVGAPPEEEQRAAVLQGLAVVQQSSATWTRAQLMRAIGAALPGGGTDPAAAVDLLERLTDRALASEFEPVISMEAPQWPAVPDYLRRGIDGRSVYTRPGAQRYATQVQLSLEERLTGAARAEIAPHLTRSQAITELGTGADGVDGVDEAVHAQSNAATDAQGRRQLRLDQAAALSYVLTSPRVAEVLTGPAGSGKTRTLAAAARAWRSATGGDVIGTATSQQARNVLAEAGIEVAENTAALLGHVPGQRGARGMRQFSPGTLVLLDEASMTSVADLADIVIAARRGAKVIVAGDQQQLPAVEGGGGMSLLAAEYGYVQLTTAVRFTEAWEQEASLALRSGQESAITAYDEHGRITGGAPDDMMEAARRAYVSHYLDGTDVLLIAGDRARCRELSRRIRDDLIHLRRVHDSRAVRLAAGTRAGTGDLIICRRNNNQVHTSPGRTLANGDILRIEAIHPDGTLTVRLRGDRKTGGGYHWASGTFTYRGYQTAELAYATTAHAAQGQTTTVGLILVAGTEDRPWLYSAMTRGAALNRAFVFTRPAQIPDPAPGTVPAPELARHEQLERERGGHQLIPSRSARNLHARDARAVLRDVLDRGASDESATTTLRRALADADHLAGLLAIWEGETAGLRRERYRSCVAAALPAGCDPAELDTPQATWLWRTLRAAETAGHDITEAVERAVSERSPAGARDLPSVLDSRLRRAIGPATPAPPLPWSAQVPACGGERQRYLTQIAAAMDDRKTRIGEFAAEHSPAWATAALGPVPDDPLDRLDWQTRAAHIGAYRELYGWDHDTEPAGPEPAGDSPEKRAAWHAAWSAITRTGQHDMSRLSDGALHQMRASYAAETAWAPPHAAAELRQVRAAALDMQTALTRSLAEADLARNRRDLQTAARHDALASSATAAAAFYAQREQTDQALAADRADWQKATAQTRHLAVLADAELRRRHPGTPLPALRSAEPVPLPDQIPAVTTPGEDTRYLTEINAIRHAFRGTLEQRAGNVGEPLRQATGPRSSTMNSPLLRPPLQQIRPAARILDLYRKRELEPGA